MMSDLYSHTRFVQIQYERGCFCCRMSLYHMYNMQSEPGLTSIHYL